MITLYFHFFPNGGAERPTNRHALKKEPRKHNYIYHNTVDDYEVNINTWITHVRKECANNVDAADATYLPN